MVLVVLFFFVFFLNMLKIVVERHSEPHKQQTDMKKDIYS